MNATTHWTPLEASDRLTPYTCVVRRASSIGEKHSSTAKTTTTTTSETLLSSPSSNGCYKTLLSSQSSSTARNITESAHQPTVIVRRRVPRLYSRSRTVSILSVSVLCCCLLNVISVVLLSLHSVHAQSASHQPQYAPAPVGCEWRARSASSHIFGHIEPTDSSQSSSTAAGITEMMLTCRMRTLNGALDSGANLALIPPEKTHGLALICDDVLFESSIHNRSFERLHQLRELHIERCKLSELPADMLAGLSELRQLSVRTHNADWGEQLNLRLAASLFTAARRVEQLDLSENGLQSVPSPLLCPLARLHFLNLSANALADVASMGFSAKSTFDEKSSLGVSTSSSPTASATNAPADCRRFDSLTHVDASQNRVKVLTDRGFGRLQRLQSLNLRHNQIVRAEETSLAGLAELSKLDLSNNQLVALPARFFQAVKTTLSELHLQNNSISVIPPGLFSGLIQVTVLDLAHNEVTSHWIGPATFSDMSRLLSLDLSHNKLTRIDASAFRALFTLQSLSLAHNEIESLAENAFAANRNLHTLSLSGNRLTSLDANSFAGLEVLNALFLDHNRILHINPSSFANITNLMELNLGGNRLEAVPIAIANLHSLRSLDLSYNRIRDISNASYQGLEQLYGLNVEGNLVGNLSRGDFSDLPSLRVLNLAANRIGSVEQGTFDNIPDLHALRLDSNGLADMNGLFANLRDLLMLNVSANRITVFDYALIPVGLQWLDLHDNQIEQLGNYFEIEAELKLRTLDASSNRLNEIEAASLPDGIELVLLNKNRIKKIAAFTFLKKSNLTRADLSDNRLASLDQNALRLSEIPVRRPLPEFSIASNPFVCDCHMEWLQREALSGASSPSGASLAHDQARQYPRIVDAHLIQCRLAFGRGSIQMQPLISANPSSFLCSYRSHCFALCHCCEFDACDCEMTCPDNCTCFYDQSWNTNIVDCGANQHSNVPGRIPMDVTDLYLDGNVIPELGPNTFIGRKNLRHLFLNGSNVRSIQNRTFNGLKSLQTLSLANNQIEILHGNEFERLGDLRELYLQHNHIAFVGNDTFTTLRSLRILRIDHNRIVEFELWVGLANNAHLHELSIGGNDWSCECHFVARLMEWLPIRSEIVRDLNQVHCQYNETYASPLAPIAITDSNVADIEAARANISAACSHYAKRESIVGVQSKIASSSSSVLSTNHANGLQNTALGQVQVFVPVIVLVIASTIGCLLLLASIVTAVLYRHELGVWFYARTGLRLGGGRRNGRRSKSRKRRAGDYGEDSDERLFDAFLSYSKKDELFVQQMLAPELEFGATPMRLCLHYRDLPVASGFVSDAIVEAMAASRRTILVISEHFLRNEWCQYEFKSAHQEALRSRARHKLILIFVGPVAGKDLDPDIRVWLKTAGNTCLQWGEKMFWQKLRYALPEIPASATNSSSATSSSSSSSTSSHYGRKGDKLGKNTGTLPGLTSLSVQSRTDSYGPLQHPLLGGLPGTLGRHYQSPGTLGAGGLIAMHHHQSNSHLYSPSSVHSQQSTYAYPTYHPTMMSSPVVHATPPPLPPAHPLHTMHANYQQSQQQLHHHQQQQLPSHLTMSHLRQNHLGSTNSNSADSSMITNATNLSANENNCANPSMPFVPSANSTTAVAVHI